MEIRVKRKIRRTASSSSSCSMTGVWRAVTYMKGISVVFHSPKACAHIARTMDVSSYFRSQARGEDEPYTETIPLVSTLLQEKHSVFGGERQLRECLEFTVKTYRPECILIANSCVSGVIGDDIESVAKEAEKKYDIPVIAIPCSGFLDGEFFEGYYETTKVLVEKFMSPQKVVENRVVLLGDYGGPNGEYAREMKRLLGYFDLNVVAQFPSYLPFEEINKIPSSSLNIVLGGRKHAEKSNEKIGKLLRKKFGTPYYSEYYPLGWENTIRWLRELGKIVKKETIAEKAIQSEMERRDVAFKSLKEKIKHRKTVLCIGRRLDYFNPHWIMELINLLEMDLRGIIFLNCYTPKERFEMEETIRSATSVPLYSEDEGGRVIGESEVVFTTHELNMPQIRQIFLPMLPAVGVKGELDFIHKIVRLLYRRNQRGGMIYG